MNQVRQAAQAGYFYPSVAAELKQTVIDLLSKAQLDRQQLQDACPRVLPKALIVPHAGYIYSGPIAASAYVTLMHKESALIKKIVLIGPAHRVSFKGIATVTADFFRTPLGDVAVDKIGMQALRQLNFIQQFDIAHETEHCLEVQLPFLQCILQQFSILPLLVGQAFSHEVTQALEAVWGQKDTLIIVSSDLSHYLNYDAAKVLDKKTSSAILALKPEELEYDSACGCLPIKGLLPIIKRLKLQAKLLDLRNSGDTAGDKASVVGYGAYFFYNIN